MSIRERVLNGPQTTGRVYPNLSLPQCGIRRINNTAVPMRDGVTLLADVHRPDVDGEYPVLIAASPYPRQMQNFGVRSSSRLLLPVLAGERGVPSVTNEGTELTAK